MPALARAQIGRDFPHCQLCAYLKYGGQRRQTASKHPRTVVRRYELRIVSPLSRGGAEPFELQQRRNSGSFFQTTRNTRRDGGRKARHGCLPDAGDRKRRLIRADATTAYAELETQRGLLNHSTRTRARSISANQSLNVGDFSRARVDSCGPSPFTFFRPILDTSDRRGNHRSRLELGRSDRLATIGKCSPYWLQFF